MLDALPTSGPRRRMIHSLQAYEALGLSKTLDEEVFLLPRWIEGPVLDVNVPLLSRRGRIASLAKMFAVSAYIYATRNFARETGICCWGIAGRIAMLLPSRVAGRTLGLRGPDLARGPEVARPWVRGS